jgi:hypothetical protein
MGPKLNPLLGFYDPLGLVDSAYWGLDGEGTVGWLRQSEIKYVTSQPNAKLTKQLYEC